MIFIDYEIEYTNIQTKRSSSLSLVLINQQNNIVNNSHIKKNKLSWQSIIIFLSYPTFSLKIYWEY